MLTDAILRQLYRTTRVVAVVGATANPGRPSHQVASYLKNQGYQVLPINPKYTTVLNEVCYPDLIAAEKSIRPNKIDVVDIFRKPEKVSPHVVEAIKVGARVVWMQEGIENEEAAHKARAAGLTVEMNRCLMKEHKRLFQNSQPQIQSDKYA